MERFIELVSEILEVDILDINIDSDFRESAEDWDSLMGFSLICMIEDEYSKRVSVDDFINCKTIGDLFQLLQR